MMRVLHLGAGRSPLPDIWGAVDEVRVDIDPATDPHVVADMADLGDIGEYDAVFSCHALEHLSPKRGDKALREMLRVLVPGRAAHIIVPDLTDVRPNDEVVYDSPAGPVTGRDMYYGMAKLVDEHPGMQHRNGFTPATLEAAMRGAGFSRVVVQQLTGFQMLGVGVK